MKKTKFKKFDWSALKELMSLEGFDEDVIDIDFYGDIKFDPMTEIDDSLHDIETILHKYDIKKKHKQKLYNVMANIQATASIMNREALDKIEVRKLNDLR